MEKYREIEKSIIKKFRKEIWSKFIKAIKDYELIEENDRIAVCISGGKDSMLLAKCFQELKRHGQIKFDLEFIVMNPGYNQENINLIYSNSKKLNIPIKVFNTDIFNVVELHGKKDPCYLCARMRRGHLYSIAESLNCNKIALGHHYDDVIETILLNIFYNGSHQTMMPKLKSKNFPGLELIRPLYLIREKDIINFSKYNDLTFMKCGCLITTSGNGTKRDEIKKLIKDLEKINPSIVKNIFSSSTNVNINSLLGYKLNGENSSFLDNYSINKNNSML
ncbi:MAG: ATP-binding protein [Bacilli bacterium]|nr:ATP-binding protein [Bacilli bacterium]MDD4282810.1 ATP-binding protein [Bacilli bacterium]MDD4718875.1 ATP-binding protein [Bacilli bacterium]